MPASADRRFYELLDSAVQTTTGDEDAVQQNKRIKEAEFAADSAEPNEEQTAAIRREVEAGKHGHGQFTNTGASDSRGS
ncbi:hypothetical protein PGQ11_002878 [Apiospora arundinis]|uniref:Uncharacterized protein n=1 Tax=Apiospora arundinis TaxID=335852 RepID=A0ABR2J3I4_9PEZI